MTTVAFGLTWCAIVFFSLRKVERAYKQRKAATASTDYPFDVFDLDDEDAKQLEEFRKQRRA